MQASEADAPASARWALIVAALAVVLVRGLVPFGDLLLYPFSLFATWVHEMGHGLGGLMVGGTFDRIEVFADGSGLAYGSVQPGWPSAWRAAAGLLAPPVLGAAILALSRGPRRAAIVLGVLAAAMLLSLPLWVRSVTGFVAIPIVAALVAALALRGGPGLRTLGAHFLGVMLALDTLLGIDYLFVSSVTVAGAERPSDVAIVASSIGGHHLAWGVLLALVSLALLCAGVRIAWAEPVRFRLPWRRDGARAR